MQIQLSEAQLDSLRSLAAAEGRSLSDLVREGVDAVVRARRLVDRQAVKERSLASLGRFRSGVPDLARDHDRHLDDAFGE